MKIALVVADLEGVAGVDAAEDLAFGGAGHHEACARMTEEVVAVCHALLRAGWAEVRVSDTHRSGSGQPNLESRGLPDGASLHWLEDPYALELFDGVGAVACVGMHAAGRTEGFAAHTVQVHAAWRSGFRLLSESDLVLGLAREVGARVLFVSGDDVLGRSLEGRVPFIETKRALSVGAAKSHPQSRVLASLVRAARREPVLALAPPRGPIALEFKVGGRELLRVRGPSWRERYGLGLEATDVAADDLAELVEGEPGTLEFAASAARLLTAPWR